MVLRTVFMGTPEIAVPSLRLLAERTALELVVSQPERPAGRGRRLRASPVATSAAGLGLPVWMPERLHLGESRPRLGVADLVVVMAYGAMLGPRTLALPKGGCVNLHASLLPRWRGASPLQACLRAGDAETGISVMRMAPALDAGPVYLREHLALGPRADLPWLHDALAELAALALGRFLDAWPDIEAVPQDEAVVTVCGKLGSEDGRLDWRATALELDRQVRAYHPLPGCWTRLAGERLRIGGLRPTASPCAVPPGTVRRVGDALQVACADDWLQIERLQSAGGRWLETAAWLNGHAVPKVLD